MKQYPNYYRAVEYLESLINLPAQKNYIKHRENPILYIKRTREFLNLLGSPDKKLKIIHITGTAGKGTTATMVQEILRAQSWRVGLFTSPFCTTSIEKISVQDKYIAPNEFARLVEKVKPAIDKMARRGEYGGPSYFEIFVGLALLYFVEKKCKWAVLEAGLGGRYDATNAIKHSEISAITNINFDHMDVLGNTLEKIAGDKMGIIKPHSEFFTTERRAKILRIFARACIKQKAYFHIIETKNLPNSFSKNAALATAIAQHLKISPAAIQKGIARAKLPCRFEIMQKSPLVILDGAHNPIKMQSVAESLRHLSYKNLVLVVAMAQDKDAQKVAQIIVPKASRILTTRFLITERKCTHPCELARIFGHFKRKNVQVQAFLDPHHTLKTALRAASPRDLVLVTGSFFLTGLLRERWHPEEWVLKNRASF